MTTIAWDGQTLAADRRVCADGALYRTALKIHTVPGGYIACCGDVGQIHKFLSWYRGRCKDEAPELDNFGALALVHGKLSLWDGDAEMPCEWGEKLAIGSGTTWAQAAMDFGKTAIEAVEYAATRDNGTGCGVDSVQPPRRKPARKG